MNPHTALDSDARACAKVKDEVRKRGKMLAPGGVPVLPKKNCLSVDFPKDISPTLDLRRTIWRRCKRDDEHVPRSEKNI